MRICRRQGPPTPGAPAHNQVRKLGVTTRRLFGARAAKIFDRPNGTFESIKRCSSRIAIGASAYHHYVGKWPPTICVKEPCSGLKCIGHINSTGDIIDIIRGADIFTIHAIKGRGEINRLFHVSSGYASNTERKVYRPTRICSLLANACCEGPFVLLITGITASEYHLVYACSFCTNYSSISHSADAIAKACITVESCGISRTRSVVWTGVGP